MKFFIRSVAVVALVVSSGGVSVFAEAPESAKPQLPVPLGEWAAQPKRVAEAFFDQLKTGNVDEAYDQLLKGTKIADSAKDVSMLKAKTREALQLGGAVAGAELIGSQAAGSRLISLTYLSLGKTYPLRWRFYFYQTGEQWKLIDIRISDRLAEMLGEQGAAADTAP